MQVSGGWRHSILHPGAVHNCYGIMDGAYAVWLFPGLQPRILCGGPPCVFAARSGRQRGLEDHRARVFFTHGTGLVITRGGISQGPVEKVQNLLLCSADVFVRRRRRMRAQKRG